MLHSLACPAFFMLLHMHTLLVAQTSPEHVGCADLGWSSFTQHSYSARQQQYIHSYCYHVEIVCGKGDQDQLYWPGLFVLQQLG
jgi:hypothetical protein